MINPSTNTGNAEGSFPSGFNLAQDSSLSAPHSGNSSSAIVQVGPESCWLLVCAKASGYAPRLSHLDTCSTSSDKDLFTNLNKSYLACKQGRRRLLKGIIGIKFVRFELHSRDLVDIQKEPDMPSPGKAHEYRFKTHDLLPPVGENYMLHLLHMPEDGDEETTMCLRAPKKVRDQLVLQANPSQGETIPTGWGIYLVDGLLINRLWIACACLFILASIVFGIAWSVRKNDVQGAFGVSAWMVALVFVVTGAIQANI